MDDGKKEYIEDPRIPCQYGRKCYQKNPAHHNKYKHPPDPKRKKKFTKNGDNTKKIKLKDTDDSSKNTKQNDNSSDTDSSAGVSRVETKVVDIGISNDVSESDSEDGPTNVQSEVKISNDVSESDSEHEPRNIKSPTNSENEAPKPTGLDKQSSKPTLENETSNHKNCVTEPHVCTHKTHNNEYGRKFIKQKFLLEMPEDFYQFYELCECLNKTKPSEAFSIVNLKLVGPYDVLCGKFCGIDKKDEDFLLHWRYFYDPPEMQTVLKGDDRSGYHIGYFRDSPDEKPVFMVENSAEKSGELTAVGENIFAAVSLYIEDKKKTANPFNKVQIEKLAKVVKEEAEKLKLDLSRKTKSMVKRNNKILSRTFNKIGLVVPYERKTQLGYRKLAMSDKELEAMLTKIQRSHPDQKQKLLSELQSELLTWTDIASDECDFGTGIELGWDIICHGVEDLNHTAERFLVSNFRQLKWETFAKIAQAHMTNRKKGCSLSII